MHGNLRLRESENLNWSSIKKLHLQFLKGGKIGALISTIKSKKLFSIKISESCN